MHRWWWTIGSYHPKLVSEVEEGMFHGVSSCVLVVHLFVLFFELAFSVFGAVTVDDAVDACDGL